MLIRGFDLYKRNSQRSIFAMYRGLKELYLHGNNIGDKGCVALSKNLPRLGVKFMF